MNFFIDNKKVVTAVDNRFTTPGNVGLWCDQMALKVRNFKITSFATTQTLLTNTYMLSVDSRKGLPGLDTGINLISGDRLTIKASGAATDGVTDPLACYREPTNPDGVSILNGSPCTVTFPDTVDPPAPVGTLLARISQVGATTSIGWFVVGSNYSSTVPVSGRLYLIYNDSYHGDNSGSYQVTITVEHG